MLINLKLFYNLESTFQVGKKLTFNLKNVNVANSSIFYLNGTGS